MSVSTAKGTLTEIALALGLSEDQLFEQAVVTFLYERKRQILQLRLEILARYGASSISELESRIAQGKVAEHPAWEDLIVAENLGSRLEELDVYLVHLSNTEGNRSQ